MDRKLVAIGDIHGCVHLLENLLSQIEKQWEWDRLIFLGDYIDRGPHTKEVIDLILSWKEKYPDRIFCLKGNHEQWMLHSLHNPSQTSWILGMEGLTTIASYEPALANRFRAKIIELGPKIFNKTDPNWTLPFPEFFHKALPLTHLEFFQNLLPYYQEEGALFVHAGLKPGVPLAKQSEDDLFWICDEFYENYQGEDWVLFGHFMTTELRKDGKPLPFVGNNKIIGIDTGSFYSGVLTAYRWPDGSILST